MTAGPWKAVGEALGSPVRDARPVSGGDINLAFQVSLQDGRTVFVKSNPAAPAAMFPAEARGLRWLQDAGAIRVPDVLAESPTFLVLQWVAPGRKGKDFDERLGQALATLHRHGAPGFGLDHDNFIGRLSQLNQAGSRADWATFYAERRLEPQLRLAVDARLVSPGFQRGMAELLSRLPARVGPTEPPARLHGDLWAGNHLVDAAGEPVLIDPAVYGGHREVDLAMMQLFGGYGPRVFSAYDEAHPRATGHEERVALYQLYFLLVHVNLFGRGYVAQAQDALSAIV